jgi:hypothetical protein
LKGKSTASGTATTHGIEERKEEAISKSKK